MASVTCQMVNMCDQAGRSSIVQCFLTLGKLQAQEVLPFLSNGLQSLMLLKTGPLKAKLCQPSILPGLIGCVYSALNRLNNTQTCSTVEEYGRIQLNFKRVISITQGICENGTVPIARTCTETVNVKIFQCYSGIGLDPNLSVRALSISNRTYFAFLGDDPATTHKLCRSLKQLQACTQRILSECPSANEEMAVNNFDYASVARGVVSLCRDIDGKNTIVVI
ncbi:hypothetical protein ACJMK2_022667 [Sinanodonta woodiana]|uniref:Uncharacterized protein n=1 Tax=Sinanodonta woodiana TaxID=1069815 RepID=A0ABD3TKT0_SINWO